MIYSIAGTLALKEASFAVVETGGLGLKLFASKTTLEGLPSAGTDVKFFCHLHVREDALDLFGFTSADELEFFEMLISVSGVGPRSALAILDTAPLNELSAAIKEGRPDLLTRAAGIGRKTAERVIVELKTKVQSSKSGAVVEKMQTDSDLVEALMSLGYHRDQARSALAHVDEKVIGAEDRLRAALAVLSNKQK
ncbi:MAG TPA: Holliday junction branch migration protein RuvA [Candidatus Paceibacterota bacterium]|nr:Holliday junction branch migration protein RuvA [Candidatus Paceibacterota bacterium]